MYTKLTLIATSNGLNYTISKFIP